MISTLICSYTANMKNFSLRYTVCGRLKFFFHFQILDLFTKGSSINDVTQLLITIFDSPPHKCCEVIYKWPLIYYTNSNSSNTSNNNNNNNINVIKFRSSFLLSEFETLTHRITQDQIFWRWYSIKFRRTKFLFRKFSEK